MRDGVKKEKKPPCVQGGQCKLAGESVPTKSIYRAMPSFYKIDFATNTQSESLNRKFVRVG